MSEPFKSLEEMADELYESIPTGEVNAFDLIKLIKEFHSRLTATIQTHELREKPKGTPAKEFTDLRDYILQKEKEGIVVFNTVEGFYEQKLEDIINQPVDGLLYDLNRDRATVLTRIEEEKWVNDFAVYQVIKKLAELREKGVWQKYLDTDEKVDGSFVLFFRDNGKILGDIYKEVDGYYVFSPDLSGGCWESHMLRLISALLDDKNKEWDEQVRNDLSNDGMTGEA